MYLLNSLLLSPRIPGNSVLLNEPVMENTKKMNDIQVSFNLLQRSRCYHPEYSRGTKTDIL